MPKEDKKSNSGNRSVDLTPDALISALEGQGGDDRKIRERSLTLFAGLVADDDDTDRIRLYQDYELISFISIARADVMLRERSKNQAGTEVSLLWVNKNAEVKICEISSEQVQAALLSQGLRVAASGSFPSISESEQKATTPTVTLVTKVFCTNITCLCTQRHSLLCSLSCSLFCPLPKTQVLPC